MRFISSLFVSILPFVLIAVAGVTAFTQQARAEDEKKAEGEAKPEGGAPKADGADREWAKRTTKLNVLEAKIKELEKNLELYIKSKNSGATMVDEKGNKIDAVAKIAEAYKELLKTSEDYNKAKDELTYRFPEEGALIDRKYVPIRERSIEQIEKESGLTGDLTRTKAAIDKKYQPFTGEKKEMPKKPDQPEATLKDIKHGDEPATDQPQRLKLSE